VREKQARPGVSNVDDDGRSGVGRTEK